MTLYTIGVICTTLAIMMKLASYHRQVKKTLRVKRSTHVSSSAFLFKICEYLCTIIGLSIFCNWGGVLIALGGLTFCSYALYIIAQHKPKKWRLFK